MWPVYQHLPQQVFEGFEYPGPALLRMLWVSRVRSLDDYPLMLRLRLPDDWMQRSMHHTLNLATVSPARARPVPVALSLPSPPLPPPAMSWAPPFVHGLAPLSTQAPRLDAWAAVDGVSVSGDASRFLVQGNSSPFGYQLSSPPIRVPPYSKVVVRIFGTVEQGRVAFGILDGVTQQWLMPAVWGESDFVARTGANDRIVMVFANALQPADGSLATRFSVQSVTYDVQNSILDRVRTRLWPVYQ